MIGRGKQSCGEAVSKNAAIFLHITCSAALLNQDKVARKNAVWTSEILDDDEASLDRSQGFVTQNRNQSKVMGGKQGWGTKNSSESRQKSLAIFLSHRREEQRRELNLIQSYIEKDHTHKKLLNFYRRVFLISKEERNERSSSASHPEDSKVFAMQLVTSLLESFGLQEYLKHIVAFSKNPPKNLLHQKTQDMIHFFQNNLTNKTFLKFSGIFGAEKDANSKDKAKMEICSGSGEWVVSQAQHDAGKCNWISLEIRHDRVHKSLLEPCSRGLLIFALLVGMRLKFCRAISLQKALTIFLSIFQNLPSKLVDLTQKDHIF